MLEAGVKDNVIPPTAKAVVNFRLHQRDSIEAVTAHVRDAINDPKVDVTARTETKNEASKMVGLNDPAYLYLSRTIKEAFALPIAPELMTGATEFVPLSRHRGFRCCVFVPSLPTPTIWYACTAPINKSRSMISGPRSASTCALCAS